MKFDKSPTELLYPSNMQIDKMNLVDAFKFMLNDQSKVISIINTSMQDILKVIEKVVEHIKKNKSTRLIYCGAGTSGRIAVQDGVELTPTFGWPKSRIDFLIAGGKKSLIESIENAEDDINSPKILVEKKKINSSDIVFGLAASGNTQFTNQVLKYSYLKKALTIAISNNPKGLILKNAELKINLNTKEEVVAGSTRLKAGTAQKICLNIISTLVMTQLGRVKQGMMINMVPKNKKLRQRAEIIKKKLGEQL
tara:strand:+ start:731 stop:1486 length:756 start_codon:yes stop_codon:yes gene_type:complete